MFKSGYLSHLKTYLVHFFAKQVLEVLLLLNLFQLGEQLQYQVLWLQRYMLIVVHSTSSWDDLEKDGVVG